MIYPAVIQLNSLFPQSGKTTIGIGALREFQRQGIQVGMVVPSTDWARDVKKRRIDFPCEVRCIAHAVSQPWAEPRVYFVDNFAFLKFEQAGRLMERLVLNLQAHTGPTQIIVAQ